MRLITETSLEVPEDIVYFETFEVEIARGGVKIRAKAPRFAEWIQSTQVQLTAGGKPRVYTEAPPWRQTEGEPLWFVPKEDWGGIRQGFAPSSTFGAGWFYNEKPNMTWLFHKDLATGLEIVISQPISMNQWEDYFSSCCSAITDIWTNELRTATVSARFLERVGQGQRR